MTTPVTAISKTNLLALDPNLATNQVADPALRKACFDEIYAYFDTFVTAYNAFVASGGVATANIADLAVTTAKLALLSVTAAQIASDAVTTLKIIDLAITNAKIATGLDAVKIADGSVNNTEFQYINSLTSNAQTQLDAKIPLTQRAAANGVATLDSGAKVPIAQLPDAVVGALEYQGAWNASTNSPTLTSTPTALKGNYYVVSVAGTQFTISFDVGDWIVSNGTIWQKIDNTDAVSTVFGRNGAIVAATNDYTFAQIDKTTSSLADLAIRSASDLSSGILPASRMPALTGSDVASDIGTVALVLSDTGVVANTYKSVTVDKKGRVTLGTNPTTIAGFGITDVAPLSHVGSYGVSQHAIVDNLNAGFISPTSQAKLDSITLSSGGATIPSTMVVAASNSKDTTKANYVCTGTGDQATINTAIAALPVIVVESGTAQAGAASTVTLASGANGTDNYYTGYTIVTTGGTGSGQSKAIAGYVGSTKVATVASAWVTNPDATTTYNITTPCGKVILLEGLFSVASAIAIPNNVSLEGQGNGTLIKVANGINSTMDVIHNADTTNGNGSISISKLKIDGNKANNTGTQTGIRLTLTNNSTIQNVTITNTRGACIVLTNSKYNSVFSNYCSQGLTTGITMQTSASYNTISNNTSTGNGTVGISVSSGNNNIINNICQNNSTFGIQVSGSTNNMVSGNLCQGNGTHGILLSSSASNNSITNNTCLENSQTTSNTSDNINIDSSSNTNNIQGNTCRQGATTNLPRYGLRVNASNCTGNLVTNNDLTTGGTTGAYSDLGTSTITTGVGNKLA